MLAWVLLILINLYLLNTLHIECYVNIRDASDGKYYRVKLDNRGNFIEREEVKIRED
jgi:hypothetical protein